MRSTAFALLAMLGLGCSSSPGSPDSRGPDGGPDTLTTDERGAFERGSDSHLTAQHTLGLADSLFGFDPTIDPGKSAAQNATSIQTHATSQLGGCGSVKLDGTTITVDFGPPPGCTFPNGTKASGSLSLGVSGAGGTVAVTATFTGLVVNGKDLSGTASFATSNGTTYAVTLNLTSSATNYTGNLTVTGNSGSMNIDGTLSSKSGDSTRTLTFTKVIWVAGQCYPSSGTIRIESGLLVETISFTSSTPTTGQVQVTILKRTVTTQLPAYGNCPPKNGSG